MTQPKWTDREVRQAAQDTLRFNQYCQVLTNIVHEADTPLTIGVFGPWGSGKTSLMRLVEEATQKQYKAPFTVWFNAWKYDQEEVLWRALVIQVLNAFRPSPGVEAPELTQRLDDLEASLYRTVEREEVGRVTIDWDKLLKGSITGLTHLSLSALPGVGAVLGEMMKKAQQQITGEDLTTIFDAIQRERRKIYREHIRSLEQFQYEFEQLVKEEVIDRDRRLVVFIDDLDRCLPEKAIEVLEALKLFLDVPGCVFFLGADREVIQRGIRVKYKGFLVDSDDPLAAGRRIPITGDNYLEKIVQLPFHLLPLDEARVEAFINQSGVDLPAGCADLFAAGLEANPRKVKRTLNIFRMLYELARIRQAEFKVDDQQVHIKPQLLAKVVVIQSRYPRLYNDLVEYPTLLPDLEQACSELAERVINLATQPEVTLEAAPSATESSTAAQEPLPKTTSADRQTLLEKYLHLRPLQRLLNRGERFADLPLAEVKLYLYLTYTTDESSQAPIDENLPARWLTELLSDDLTKIKSAVAAIQEDAPTAIPLFQRRLLEVLGQQAEKYALNQRFSAGTALALLGDPRDFNETIQIPAGDYPVGPGGQRELVEGFKISRYPVTNLQYQRFLAQNPDHPAPDPWDQTTRACPPEFANHPVTHVSWDDAQAYCRWAGKRLPSAREWEAAAQGKVGRRYPYGDEPLPDAANTIEVDVNSPSPVGMFPAGASPFGLVDMAGNVWEWTSTGQAEYALKGGAWNTPATESACAHTGWQSPNVKGPAIGFRVAE
jgi:hypothetical protein